MFFSPAFKYTLIIWIAPLLFIFSQESFSQEAKRNVLLNEIVLEELKPDIQSTREYYLLQKRVLKVYPYLDILSSLLDSVDLDIQKIHKKRIQRRYSRKVQKKIVNQFSQDVMKLSRKEGVVLSKLIHRKFKLTGYELIVIYRGSMQAFFWHRLSKLYDGDLKSTFNPLENKEDFYIQTILNDCALE